MPDGLAVMAGTPRMGAALSPALEGDGVESDSVSEELTMNGSNRLESLSRCSNDWALKGLSDARAASSAWGILVGDGDGW